MTLTTQICADHRKATGKPKIFSRELTRINANKKQATGKSKATATPTFGREFAGGARVGRHLVWGLAAETVGTEDVRCSTVAAASQHARGSVETTVHSFRFFRG